MATVLYPTLEMLHPDGITNNFTLSNPPEPGSLLLILNGLVQIQENDFTISGAVITTTAVPGASDSLMAYYTTIYAPTIVGGPGGMRFDPEVIANALFILLGTAGFAFKSMDRRGNIWGNVAAADQPYLALIERGGSGVQNQAIGLEKWTLHFLVLVYIRADAIPSAIPATPINAAWKAIAGAMNSSPIGERQTLGGLVNNAWINGQVMIDTGILDQQCVLLIPIDVETGL